MKRDLISTIMPPSLASLPLLLTLFLSRLSQPVYNNEIAYSATVCSFIYTLLSINKFLTWQQYIKIRRSIQILLAITLILNLIGLQMLTLLGSGRDSMLNQQRVSSLAASLFVFSLTNFLIMETVVNQIIPFEIKPGTDQEDKIMVGFRDYFNALKWMFVPILGSVLATVVTYFWFGNLLGYENSFGNHGTALGIYLGLFVLVKQTVDNERKSRVEHKE